MKEITIDKRVRLLIFTVALIFIGAVGVGVYVFSFVNANKPVTGVLLETGDMYFGRLSYFPRLSLEEVYVVQSVTDPLNPTQTIYQVVPLRFSIWSPSKINLNYDKIVFMGRVGEDSQVMRAIREQGQ